MEFSEKHVMIFAIHRTSDWWRFVGSNLGCSKATVVTDLRDEGDVRIVDDFYSYYNSYKNGKSGFSLLSEEQIVDIIARCRVLRWLDVSLARNLIKAMAMALNKALDELKPDFIVSLPIDRYPTDILDRLADARGLSYVQLTASVLPGMSMLLKRGKMLKRGDIPAKEEIEEKLQQLLEPTFVPSYVPDKIVFNQWRFIKTLSYFRLRGLVFKALGFLKRDPLNLHYLDAQPTLGHKCSWKDIRISKLVRHDWEEESQKYEKNKRVMFGLQLFPEASIDYWIQPIELIDYEDLIVKAAQQFSDEGFVVLVKDHPLQFGFRKTELVDRLLDIPNVVIVPYDVPGQVLLDMVDVNFTFTGTLGLQASLLGKSSFVTDSYYTTEEDFYLFGSAKDIESEISAFVKNKRVELTDKQLTERKERLAEQVIQGSFPGDLFSFQGFDAKEPAQSAAILGKSLGQMIKRLGCH